MKPEDKLYKLKYIRRILWILRNNKQFSDIFMTKWLDEALHKCEELIEDEI